MDPPKKPIDLGKVKKLLTAADNTHLAKVVITAHLAREVRALAWKVLRSRDGFEEWAKDHLTDPPFAPHVDRIFFFALPEEGVTEWMRAIAKVVGGKAEELIQETERQMARAAEKLSTLESEALFQKLTSVSASVVRQLVATALANREGNEAWIVTQCRIPEREKLARQIAIQQLKVRGVTDSLLECFLTSDQTTVDLLATLMEEALGPATPEELELVLDI